MTAQRLTVTPISAQPILIVEDEPKLATLLADYLHAAGLRSIIVADGLVAESAVRAHDPSVVLLDLMLPGRDGLEICRALRTFSQVPVIMMTAKVEEVSRLMGLEVGADDYICKPYSPREVVARVQAQLRRQQWQARSMGGEGGQLPPRQGESPKHPVEVSGDCADTPGLTLNEEALRASWQGQVLELTPAEFRLLAAMARQGGRVLSRDRLLDHLHDDGRAVTDRTVDSHVRNLRRKLSQHTATGDDPIRSVYGVGYAWDGPPAR